MGSTGSKLSVPVGGASRHGSRNRNRRTQTALDIGNPTGFVHLDHIGPEQYRNRANGCFQVLQAPRVDGNMPGGNEAVPAENADSAAIDPAIRRGRREVVSLQATDRVAEATPQNSRPSTWSCPKDNPLK